MLKSKLVRFALPLLLLFGNSSENSVAGSKQKSPDSQTGATGTLQKMIVESGSVTRDLDLNRLNGTAPATGKLETGSSRILSELRFAFAANSFFPILVFNNVLRGPQPGSIALIPQNSATLPAAFSESLKQLVVEKLPSGGASDLAVRDSNTGFTYFNIEGHQYDYDANAHSLAITNGRLLISKQFANALGRPSDAGSPAGQISIGASMQPTEIARLVNGQPKSVVMPPLRGAAGGEVPALVAGPDVIVGDVESVEQQGSAGTQVGLAIGTDSCNNGDQPVDWFALPQTDHPIVPQNLYRMSGGTSNNDRFEQIGQSWVKHTFEALESTVCGTCNTANCQTGTHLCPGCSDPYTAGLNGDQDLIGSRAWINPFTGSFPSSADDHTGHVHDDVSHRIRVETSDLIPAQNPGATYFGEAAYISPHEYTWCQAHPTQCNMYNNVSRRQFSVTGGPTSFTFSPVSSTVRMQPAIQAWAATGATVNQIQPDPGNDGIIFVGYKVTGPTAGVWHYEYAIYNENLDRAIQSFEVVFPGFEPFSLTDIGFHAPPQEPGWVNDGTFNNQGYSSAPWTFNESFTSATWNCETLAQNPNANAIRWGTLYNFRFDSTAPPAISTANVGFFKTGSPISVEIQAPEQSDATPTPTPSATPPTPTPTATPTPTVTPTATPTPTPTATPTVTPTPTPTPTPSGITLTAAGRRVQGRHTVDLIWSGATSANIDIYRNGVVIATVPNNGSYKDFIGVRGGNVRYTYKVCEAGTQNCSNGVTVRFGGPPL
jgi:hypothetical protein